MFLKKCRNKIGFFSVLHDNAVQKGTKKTLNILLNPSKKIKLCKTLQK